MNQVEYETIARDIISEWHMPFDRLVEFIRDIQRSYWRRGLDPSLLHAELSRQLALEHDNLNDAMQDRILYAFNDVFHVDWMVDDPHSLDRLDDDYYQRQAIDCFWSVIPGQGRVQAVVDFLLSLGHDSSEHRSSVVKLRAAILRLIRKHHPLATFGRVRVLDQAFFQVHREWIVDPRAWVLHTPRQRGPSGGAWDRWEGVGLPVPSGGEDYDYAPEDPVGGPL